MVFDVRNKESGKNLPIATLWGNFLDDNLDVHMWDGKFERFTAHHALT